MKEKKKKRKKNKVSMPRQNHFLYDEAAAMEDFNTDDEDDEEEDVQHEDDLDGYSAEGDLLERGMSESETDSDSDEDTLEDGPTPRDEASGDISEQLVLREEAAAAAAAAAAVSQVLSVAASDEDSQSSVHDHTYASRLNTRTVRRVPQEKVGWGTRSRYKYSFLFAMVTSGAAKRIKNCIPRGVAILSNSKTIILGHVHAMLECLDPGLAEICYMDTDSCIFSFTHEKLEENLLPDKISKWNELDIIADEDGESSCHGKLKLEGTFKVGLFKALKIYRLFSTADFEKESREKTCYTRCKGVNRNIAKMIPNAVFDQKNLNQVVVHRSCLRPSRTGEMIIAHECKSLAAPFNLKRHVTSDGLHTFPLSYFPDGDGGEAL
jgi:hypothetical protein